MAIKILPIRSALQQIRKGDASALIGGLNAGIAMARERRAKQAQERKFEQVQAAQQFAQQQEQQKAFLDQQEQLLDMRAKQAELVAERAPGTLEAVRSALTPALRAEDPQAKKNLFRAGVINLKRQAKAGHINDVTPLLSQAFPGMDPEKQDLGEMLGAIEEQQLATGMQSVLEAAQSDFSAATGPAAPRKLQGDVIEAAEKVAVASGLDPQRQENIDRVFSENPGAVHNQFIQESKEKLSRAKAGATRIDLGATGATKSRTEENMANAARSLSNILRLADLVTGPNGEDRTGKFFGYFPRGKTFAFTQIENLLGEEGLPPAQRRWLRQMLDIRGLVKDMGLDHLRELIGSQQTETELRNTLEVVFNPNMSPTELKAAVARLTWKYQMSYQIAQRIRSDPRGATSIRVDEEMARVERQAMEDLALRAKRNGWGREKMFHTAKLLGYLPFDASMEDLQ